jgi:hypothetical protein
VSEKHGDKARFDRERQKKNLRRKHTREIRKKLALKNNTAGTAIAEAK